MRKALRVFAKTLGPDHASTQTVAENYTALLEQMGRSSEQVRAQMPQDQGGDAPMGTQSALGTGGPGFRIKAEFNSRKHVKGTVAMARSMDPDSAGSQFYICFAPQPGLDGQYTVFGQVTEGLDVLDQIGVGDTIESIKVEKP